MNKNAGSIHTPSKNMNRSRTPSAHKEISEIGYLKNRVEELLAEVAETKIKSEKSRMYY